MKYRNFLKDKNNKGFTLIELVVVLVIIALLAAITVPVVTGYIEDAREAEDYAKIGILNRSSSAYRAFVYQDNPTQVDVFEGIEDNKDKQEKLVEKNLLDEVLTSRKGGYFSWNVAKQLWELGDGSEPSTPVRPNDGTILDQGKGEEHKQIDYEKTYQKGDFFKIGDALYKVLVDMNVPIPATNLHWAPVKEIKLDYDKDNPYEKGDIVKYSDGKYYKRILQNTEYHANQGQTPGDDTNY